MSGREAGGGVQRAIQPDDIGPPLGRYAHAIEVAAGARHLAISGQVGVAPDGSVADGIEAQLETAWSNIVSILHAAGMTTGDIIKVTTYVTRPEHFAVHPRVRAQVLGDHRATATAVCVSALAAPEYLCEIDVLAAAPAK
jgi:enamine deaminase RidA (YjgF/YER057c/UK114 family)